MKARREAKFMADSLQYGRMDGRGAGNQLREHLHQNTRPKYSCRIAWSRRRVASRSTGSDRWGSHQDSRSPDERRLGYSGSHFYGPFSIERSLFAF